jgi:RNA polymerase sigma factor (sigma-70 family)
VATDRSDAATLAFLRAARTLDQGPTDGQLLARFLATRDETAFEALVRRHGPMVWGVCRRILGSEADAEDAFQATFLVLLRRAADLVSRAVVGDWLHGVARHAALKARAAAARRRARERRAVRPEAPTAEARNDWLPLLDEEVARLPEKYRLAVVLCDLEGAGRKEAAARLGWPEGTVAGRLARGRALLARRLLRRTQALSSAALATGAARAALPPALVRATTHAVASARPGTGGAVPPGAEALAGEVLREMLLTRFKAAAALAVLLALLGMGAAGLLAPRIPAQAPSDRPVQQPGPRDGEAALLDRAGDPLPRGALARLGTVRFRHGEYVHCAVFTRDGKTLITGGADSTIRLWEVPTGRPLRRLEGHRGWVGRLALSPDGKTLASGGSWWDNSLRVWDLASGKELRCLDRGDFPVGQPLAFAPDGKTLYAARAREIEVWEVGSGLKLRSFRPLPERTRDFTEVALSPDGKTLAVTNSGSDPAKRFGGGVSGGTLRLLDSRTGKELRKRILKDWAPGLVAFSPDGRALAMQGAGAIEIWSPDLEKELLRIPTPETDYNRFAFSPDSRLLAVAAFNGASAPFRIRVWDLRSGKEYRQLPGHDHQVNALAFTPDGKMLASGSSGGSVRLWDLASGAELAQPAAHHGWVWGVAVSADGRLVATANSDRTVRVWEARTGKPLRELRGHQREVWAVRFAPAGHVLATGSWDGTVRLWDADTGKELHRLAGHAGEVRSVAFSPDGSLLASGVRGTDTSIHLRDVGTGREVGRLPLDQATPVTALAFSPDGRHLASGGVDIRLWDVARKRPLPWFRPPVEGPVEGLAFSADGRSLLSRGKHVQLWETVTGRERARLTPPADHRFCTAALAPDGRRIVTSLNAGSRVVTTRTQVLEFWDLSTGKCLGRRSGHVGLIGCAAWSPDGRFLVTGSDDTSALVWDTTPLVCP